MTTEDSKGPDEVSAQESKPPTTQKVYKMKPRYPPIAEMLVHGAPESQGKPKTFLQIIEGPVLLTIVFFISLAIFLIAPHHLSKAKQRATFVMNQKPIKYVKPVIIPYVPPDEMQSTVVDKSTKDEGRMEQSISVTTDTSKEL